MMGRVTEMVVEGFLVSVLVLGWSLQVQAAQEGRETIPTKIRISQSALSTRSAPLWIAQEQGFFNKYGVEVEIIYLRNSATQMAALARGSVQMSSTGGTPTLTAAAGGLDLKIVAALTNQLTYELVTRSDIKAPENLRQKRLGVTTIGGTTWLAAILALEHMGLDPQRDRIMINGIGNQAILTQALEVGNIDATLVDPFLGQKLSQRGFRILLSLYRANIPFINHGIVITSAYLREHPVVVENVLKALVESLAFLYSPANKPVVLRTMMKHLKVSDPTVAEEGYEDIMIGLERKPYPSLDAMRNIQRVMAIRNPRVTQVRLQDLIDDRIVRKLGESGFIDSLYTAPGKR